MARDVTVIVPAAGGATWCLQRPDGRTVFESIVHGLDLRNVSAIIAVVLQADVDRHCGGDVDALEAYLTDALHGHLDGCRVQFLSLTSPTESATETVRRAIDELRISGPIFVKDCDGAFEHVVTAEDAVVALKVDSRTVTKLTNLPSKSFVEECGGLLTNIVEKHMVSDLVCVGGYGFRSAQDFIRADDAVSETIRRSQISQIGATRSFTSHLILHLLLEEGTVFRVLCVSDFEDWKSAVGWRQNSQEYRNVIVALEGVLVVPKTTEFAARVAEHASRAANAPIKSSSYVPMEKNIEAVRAQRSRFTRIVITSTRPESDRRAVMELLEGLGLQYDSLVLGMQRATTSVIAAHDSVMLPQPAVSAHSIPANTGSIDDLFQ